MIISGKGLVIRMGLPVQFLLARVEAVFIGNKGDTASTIHSHGPLRKRYFSRSGLGPIGIPAGPYLVGPTQE